MKTAEIVTSARAALYDDLPDSSGRIAAMEDQWKETLHSTHAPRLSTAQHEAIYERARIFGRGDSYPGIEREYIDLVEFVDVILGGQ